MSEMQTSSGSKVKKELTKENKKMFIFGLGGFLLVAILVVVGITLFGVYYKKSDNRFIAGVASVMRLPALKVGGQVVLYKDYVDDLRAIKMVKDYDSKNDGPMATVSDEQLSDQVLWRLTTNALVTKLAKEYGVKIEQKEIDDIKTQVLSQFENDETKLSAELQKRYGWNLKIYENKVIRPYVLQKDLATKLATDENLKKEAKIKAQKVLDEIKGGADFAQMAKKYGEDGTASSGGDLGWFGEGVMVQPFEEAVFALQKGQITQDLVETQFGYHIIKLDDTRMGTSTAKDGKTVSSKEVKASHILFRFPALDTMLENLSKPENIKLYLKVHNPFIPVPATQQIQTDASDQTADDTKK